MKHSEGTLSGPQGLRIYYQTWQPETPPKAAVLLVHGLGEHAARHRNTIQRLVENGYAVYGPDHIGHGKSEGMRAYINRFSDLTSPLDTLVGIIRAELPNAPLFVLGHSLGGLITAYYLLDNQDKFSGAVLSAPAVKAGDDISPALIAMSRILSALTPKMGVLALDPKGISRDPQEVAAYINDPLNFHGKIPARMGGEMLTAMARVTAEAGRITLPLLIIQGSADVMVNPSGAQMLHDLVSSSDKTLKVYPGYYHEMHNEPEPDRQRVLGDVLTWLNAHAA